MYAGGEDDRPGGGPPPQAGHRVPAACHPQRAWAPAEVRAWFEERIAGAELHAQEAVLGRVRPLPYRQEVLLRSGGAGAGAAADICLVTQLSLDRLARLEEQLVLWGGEVSAAVYLESGHCPWEARHAVLSACSRAVARRAAQSSDLGDVSWTVTLLHGLEESKDLSDYDLLYPVNALRNAATAQARANLLLLLDVDFAPACGLFPLLAEANAGARLRGSLLARRSCLVVPAFEPRAEPPSCAAELLEAVKEGLAEPFHCRHFPQGHGPTDFPRWLAGGADAPAPTCGEGALSSDLDGLDAYRVEYAEFFEPYVVVPRELVPRYDERFRGYGLNKVSHLYEMAVSWEVDFSVVKSQEAFVAAPAHEKSPSWQRTYGRSADPAQRIRIAMHYDHFKAELRRGRRRVQWPCPQRGRPLRPPRPRRRRPASRGPSPDRAPAASAAARGCRPSSPGLPAWGCWLLRLGIGRQ